MALPSQARIALVASGHDVADVDALLTTRYQPDFTETNQNQRRRALAPSRPGPTARNFRARMPGIHDT